MTRLAAAVFALGLASCMQPVAQIVTEHRHKSTDASAEVLRKFTATYDATGEHFHGVGRAGPISDFNFTIHLHSLTPNGEGCYLNAQLDSSDDAFDPTSPPGRVYSVPVRVRCGAEARVTGFATFRVNREHLWIDVPRSALVGFSESVAFELQSWPWGASGMTQPEHENLALSFAQ